MIQIVLSISASPILLWMFLTAMERHRPKNQKQDAAKQDADKHRTKVKQYGDLGSKPHSGSKREVQYRDRRESLNIPSTQSVVSQKLPNDISTKSLCGEDDYVRRWLAQTDQKPDLGLRRKQHATLFTDEQDEGLTIHDTFANNLALVNTRTKKRRNSSSDSSILQAPPRFKLQAFQRPDAKDEGIETRDDRQPDPHKNRRAPSSTSEVSSRINTSLTPRHETFEKRARHKTREDRYDPKKEKHVTRGGEDKRLKKKKVTKGERKKATKKVGEDLMRNFTSKNIGQDRLTIRPSHGLGLFNNGRASSPAKRRGLPDLAFSEMDFLQHSNRRPPQEAGQKVRSKSREKERRKALRAQEEITEFFMPKRPPLREIEANTGGQGSSKYRRPEDLIFRKQDELNQREWTTNRQRSPSLDLRQDAYPSSRYLGHFSDKRSDPREAPPTLGHSRAIPDSTSQISGRATSYMSWSETQCTPDLTMNRHSTLGLRHDSPTPDHVQRSIERTGIFRDTGIRTLEDSRRSGLLESPRTTQSRNRRLTSHAKPSSHTRNESIEAPTTQSSSKLPQSLESNSRRNHVQQVVVSKSVSQPNITGAACHSSAAKDCVEEVHSRVQKSGYDGPPRCSSAAVMDEEHVRGHQLTSVDRVELAKNARIRRPSSTLPVARVPADYQVERGAQQDTTPAAELRQHKAANEEVKAKAVLESAPVLRRGGPQGVSVERNEQRLHVSPPASAGPFNRQATTNIAPHGGRISTLHLPHPAGLEHRFQTPCSASANGTYIEGLSYLGLPLRGPSNGRGPSPSIIPFGLTPITELFLHQLQQENARESAIRYKDHSFTSYIDDAYEPLHTENDHLVEYYPDEDIQEVMDYPLDDPSYDHIQHSPHYYEGEEQQLDVLQADDNGTWHPQLEPIDGQIEDNECLDDQMQDMTHGSQELFDPQIPVDTDIGHNDYEMEEYVNMGSFWRPRPQY